MEEMAMRRLTVFNQITLDGYFTGPDGDLGWAHKDDPEWTAFVEGNASGGGELMFGRKTYQMMESYWPTPAAADNDPVVARRMNDMRKVVFSRTLGAVSWANTRLLKGDLLAEVRALRDEDGDDMTILGSGSIVAQLAPHRLIDEYQVVVSPIALGSGRTMFDGLPTPVPLRLTRTRSFGNGSVLLCYVPG
jgi:dihydrofolate reductase